MFGITLDCRRRQCEVACGRLLLSTLSCLSNGNKCCVVSAADLFVTFLLAPVFSLCTAALRDNDFLVEKQMLVILCVFRFENSLRAWRGQCVCRSGRGVREDHKHADCMEVYSGKLPSEAGEEKRFGHKE